MLDDEDLRQEFGAIIYAADQLVDTTHTSPWSDKQVVDSTYILYDTTVPEDAKEQFIYGILPPNAVDAWRMQGAVDPDKETMYTTEPGSVEHNQAAIRVAATKHGVPMERALKMGDRESKYNNEAVGDGGASLGMLQVGAAAASDVGVSNWGQDDSWKNSEINADVGMKYYRQLYDTYNNWDWATIAYNWGQGNTNDYIAKNGRNFENLPAEVKDYMNFVRSSGEMSVVDLYQKTKLDLTLFTGTPQAQEEVIARFEQNTGMSWEEAQNKFDVAEEDSEESGFWGMPSVSNTALDIKNIF